MKHALMKLPFAYDALEPLMSEETLKYHYDKHHATYVANLNKLIVGTEYESLNLFEIIKNADGAIFNNAAQIYNHDMFFKSLTPNSTKVSKDLETALFLSFGTLEAFKEAFIAAGLSQFGSGWVWLCKNENSKLSITTSSNAHNPLNSELQVLMVCDLWEHAYYIDHRNSRLEYLENFFKLINWEFVSQNFKQEASTPRVSVMLTSLAPHQTSAAPLLREHLPYDLQVKSLSMQK